MSNGTCRLCGERKRLIKAHIIPAAFYREMEDPDNPGVNIMVSTEEHYTKRAPVGVYDKTILCNDCERRFGPWDEYAINLFLNTDFEDILVDGEPLACQVADFDYKRLKMFVISLVWRASVSTHKFFHGVDIGSHENNLRHSILDDDPGEPVQCATILSKWKTSDEDLNQLSKIVPDPFRERWNGVNAYRFYMGGMVAYVKVDQRPFPPSMRPYVVGTQKHLVVLYRDFETSNDIKPLMAIADKLP